MEKSKDEKTVANDEPAHVTKQTLMPVSEAKSMRSRKSIAARRSSLIRRGARGDYNDQGFLRDEQDLKEQIVGARIRKMATPVIEMPIEDEKEDDVNKIGQLEQKTPMELMENDEPGAIFAIKYAFECTRYYTSKACQKMIQHPIFETVSLLVILTNCITLALDDPRSDVQENWQIISDYVFQGLYSAELVIKVLAMGFVLNQGAYLRDLWNVLDFVIVAFGFFSYFSISSGGFDFKTLRTFRVLRPLRTITSIEGLKILMEALVGSLGNLFDAMIVLVFFLTIFAIAGLQLWSGVLGKRCKEIATGNIRTDLVCGSFSCPDGMVCVETGQNPNYGVTSFDDFFSALLNVFVIVTLEGWTDTQYSMIRAYGYTSAIFFSMLTLIGAYFLFNFTLAVIKSKVSKLYEDNRKLKEEKKIEVALKQHQTMISQGMRPFGAKRTGTLKNALNDLKSKRNIHYDILLEITLHKPNPKTESQTIPIVKYKQWMGMEELEDDCEDLKMTALDPIQEERAKYETIETLKLLEPIKEHIKEYNKEQNKGEDKKEIIKLAPAISISCAPPTFARNFKNGLKLNNLGHKKNAKSNIPELDEFTELLFEQRLPVSAPPEEEKDVSDIMSASLEFDENGSPKGLRHKEESEESDSQSSYKGSKEIGSRVNEEIEPRTEEEKVEDTLEPIKDEEDAQKGEEFKALRSRRTSVFLKKVMSNAEDEEDKKEQIKEPIEETKFVLVEGIIDITSYNDVYSGKGRGKNNMQDKTVDITIDLPPYRIKVNYEPTELPEEEPEEDQNQEQDQEKANQINLNIDPEKGQTKSVKETDKQSAASSSRKLIKKKKKKKGKKPNDSASHASEEKKEKSSKTSEVKGQGTINPLPIAEADKVSINPSSVPETDTLSKTMKSAKEDQKEKDSKKGKGKDNEEEDEDEETLPVPDLLTKYKVEDNSTNRRKLKWSGQEVLNDDDPYRAVWVTEQLSVIKIPRQGYKGMMLRLRHLLKVIIMSEITSSLMSTCALANTVLLAMNRHGQPESEAAIVAELNTVFTSIFIVEMGLKLISLGIVGYLIDPMNILDGFIVILSVIEMVFLDSSGFSGLKTFQAFRILRTLRVVRMVRFLRSLRSMKLQIQVIGEAIVSFAYIGGLLLIFLFIYSLLGMQLFGGKFNFSDGKPRQNFDSFYSAFLCMYQVLTVENWQSLLYSSMHSTFPALVALFYVSWLFIGNYVLLNLFLALMLDTFSDAHKKEDEENGDDESEETESVARSTTIATTEKASVAGTHVTVTKSLKSKFGTGTSETSKSVSNSKHNTFTGKKNKKSKVPLEDSQCNYCLYIFSKENPLRIFCWYIVTHKYFEWVVLTLIVVSSFHLAFDSFYLLSPDPFISNISDSIQTAFVAFFSLEAALKIIVYGFVFDSGSYLRDLWNILDFSIVIASVIDLSMNQIDIPMIRILRLLRTFRPLRFLSHNVHMKIIVKALFKSLGALCNTMVLILVAFIMFSIVGVSFFSGKFQYCTVGIYDNSNITACAAAKGDWLTYDHNFDNVINGLIFLFELTTQENWPITVYQAIDATDVDTGPKFENSWYYAYFFVVFLFIGSMFLLNLFVGVMFDNFTREQQRETETFGGTTATKEQMEWIEVQRLIVRAEPNYNVRTTPDKSSWRSVVHTFITTSFFEIFISVIICLNLVQMAMLYEGASAEYTMCLDIVNYIFTGIFTIEITLKLLGYGISFWYEPWNVFDFIIVFCSYIDIIFSNVADTSLRMLRVGPQLLRVLRVVRITRLLRLVKKYKRLQEIMEIIQLCLPSIFNVFSLLTLILFIYAILGCYLFYNVTTGNSINSIYNFSNFALAMMLCLKMATGEDWNNFMFDCARTTTSCAAGLGCGNVYSYIYFISFKIIVTFIMLNLFVLVVLQLFDKYFIEDENIISRFKDAFELFQETWHMAKPSHFGFFIHQDKLRKFFKSLPESLAIQETDLNALIRKIMELGIKSDAEKNIFFNELLYCTMRRLYYKNEKKKNKPNDEIDDTFMIKQEEKTRKLIEKAALKEAKRAYYSTSRKSVFTQSSPFVSLMYLRMTLKMWKNYKISHAQRVKEHQDKGEMNYESSVEVSPMGAIEPENEEELDAVPYDLEKGPERMASKLNKKTSRPITEEKLRSGGSNEIHKEATASENNGAHHQLSKVKEMPNLQEGGLEEIPKKDS